jgi:hypothetical protein
VIIAGACLGQPVSATPIPLPPDLLPIEVPANGAFGIGIRVNTNSSDGFLFSFVNESGGLFSMHGDFGERHEYLTCINSNPGPEKPSHFIPPLEEGTLIDANIEVGDCFFTFDKNQGRLRTQDFSGTGGFIAIRANSSAPHRYGFFHARIGEDGVLRVLAGAMESEAGVPIQTTPRPQDVFGDRFETLAGPFVSGRDGEG